MRIGVLGSLPVEKNVIARRMCGEEAAWARGGVDAPAPRGASLVETFTCPYAYASEATVRRRWRRECVRGGWGRGGGRPTQRRSTQIRVSVADLDAEALVAGSDHVGRALLRGLAALLVLVPSAAPEAETLEQVARQLARGRALGARIPLWLLVRVAEYTPERDAPAEREARRRWVDFAGVRAAASRRPPPEGGCATSPAPSRAGCGYGGVGRRSGLYSGWVALLRHAVRRGGCGRGANPCAAQIHQRPCVAKCWPLWWPTRWARPTKCGPWPGARQTRRRFPRRCSA